MHVRPLVLYLAQARVQLIIVQGVSVNQELANHEANSAVSFVNKMFYWSMATPIYLKL